MNKPRLTAASAIALCLWVQAASAHAIKGGALGFATGFEHPLSGADHVIAMLAVGLWGCQLGAPAVWLLPVTFPLIMAFGGFLGLAGLHLPASEVAIAASGLTLGAMVMIEARPPLWVAAALVGVFGLFHGYAHGVELPPGQDAAFYSLGFVMATGLLHATGVTLGLAGRWRWGRMGLRLAGTAIMLGGAEFLWSATT
jgi:urease accessory protein